MVTDPLFDSQLSGRNLPTTTGLGFGLQPIDWHSALNLRWGVYLGTNSEPLAFGQVPFPWLRREIAELQKLRRRHKERLAAVSLDPDARMLLSALDRETSIRWEELPDRVGGDWRASCRAAALLTWANLCEVSPTRIRISDYGDKLLAESSPADQPHAEVAD